MVKCLFCESECISNSELNTSGAVPRPYLSVQCPICGHYYFSETLMNEITNRSQTMSPQKKVNGAYQCLNIKQGNIGKIGTNILYPFWTKRTEYDALQATKSSNDVLLIIEDIETEFVDHAEKPFKLLEILSNRLNQESAFKPIKPTQEDLILTKTPVGELEAILHFLFKKGWIGNGKTTQEPKDQFAEIRSNQIFCLTIEGWEIIRHRFVGTNSKNVFIAMKFNWPDKDREERVIRSIQKACKVYGYDAKRVDEFHTSYITDRIISDINKSKFVVAEFTHNNPGVYYEAGFAKGLGKSVFHIIDEDHTSELHFDIKQVNYKTWKEPEEIERKLYDWIGATFK